MRVQINFLILFHTNSSLVLLFEVYFLKGDKNVHLIAFNIQQY